MTAKTTKTTKTTTYVEMTDRDQLVPAAPVPELTLDPVGDGQEAQDLVARTMVRVGTPHGWRSVTRTPQEWPAWFAHPGRRCWLLRHAGEPAGVVVCDRHADGEVEIKSFGLVPEKVGQGLGGHALTLAVRQAWDLHPDVTRVWLHTASDDHPGALPNYHRRGFRTFKTETNGTD
ncbi:GNAT family N-acetyltransferase [Catenulispora yoronensis]|uniref:GNAT family N-acetyltransferase n=1 Tax=Catenulispora yoronensis TaxID=450799 RepID=UPI0031D5B337